ncbi:MAG: glycoside hydrolase family 130 protein [Christensenellales bacterium]
MEKIKLIMGKSLPDLPWEPRPKGCGDVVWRYSGNPVIGRNPIKNVVRIFNGSVLPYEGGYIGVFRGEQRDGIPHIYLGRSKDGFVWGFEQERVRLEDTGGREVCLKYAYDPRLVEIDGTYYFMWCTDNHGATIGLAKTTDFKRFSIMDNPFLPFNRNAVLFPRKINGSYIMLSRPSDGGHTPFGDVFLSESLDLVYWGKHKHVLAPTGNWWESVKVGGGAVPIETSEGWLLFYHGVTSTCNGFVYSVGCALLDRERPWIVRHRSKNFLLTPETAYEERGFVPNVCFPCAALVDAQTGRIAIYYGAADSCVALAFAFLDEIVAYVKDNGMSADAGSAK